MFGEGDPSYSTDYFARLSEVWVNTFQSLSPYPALGALIFFFLYNAHCTYA